MSRVIELSVIIPVYNEVDNVEALYDEVNAILKDKLLYFEVIFVDDGSRDDTLICLRNKAKSCTNLRILQHTKNYGQSVALVTGIKHANYSWIATLDGDGQNDPSDILKMLDRIDDDYVVVLGNRSKRDDHLIRKISSRIGNSIRKRLLNDGCPDTGCSLKLFPKQAFLELPHFNHLHRFLPALFSRAGYRLINMSVTHRPRRYGVSKYGVMNRLFVGIYDLIGVRWLLKRPCLPEVIVCDE